MAVLNALAQHGHTIIMDEHNMRLAVEANWTIVLGRGTGPGGGQMVACGKPEAVAASPPVKTARNLL
ncbi:hypothetical protein [Cupriavidus neocaledonicus]|uniref:hypothetical protein n=1 Tax=Cupriavidus neocaledonicus TaxID=1040979 RepID=UPI0011AE767F|nr:hypothetical protein [Cupriavidus neocaledonicus]